MAYGTRPALVIVDDASEDDSMRRVKKYLADPRIRLYIKEKNEGIAIFANAARATGTRWKQTEEASSAACPDSLIFFIAHWNAPPSALKQYYSKNVIHHSALANRHIENVLY
jgi:glycosyltransferase involved in cell wall biosynthesis